MNAEINVRELLGETDKTRALLASINGYFDDFKRNELPVLGKGKTSGVVFAEIFVDFYTCLETFFFRVSQAFENQLSKDKWHSDLFHKMALDVPGIRPPVIRDDTALLLAEFLRFRHFKRYYFQFEYDWERLQYLEKKYRDSMILVERDLGDFRIFLQKIS